MAKKPADRFVVSSFRPTYLGDQVRNTMAARVARTVEELRSCRACPRNCKINRLENETLVCKTGRHARVNSAFAHLGEENCLRGTRGSGTIFFSLCNLRCVFCQNWDISQRPAGREFTAGELAGLMLHLQESGCHNINLVTPEHVVPQIVEALAIAIDGGLSLPIVYNTSAYDAIASLRMLDGLIDIYMPDFKLWTRQTSARLLKAKDYPDCAKKAIREMHRQVGDLRFTPDGLACRGVLVRHLVMPGLLDESRAIFQFLVDEISPDTFVNVMGQYRPAYQVGEIIHSGRGAGRKRYTEIDTAVTATDIETAYDAARDAGLWRFDKPG